jgi:ribosome-binding factor A
MDWQEKCNFTYEPHFDTSRFNLLGFLKNYMRMEIIPKIEFFIKESIQEAAYLV